MRHPRPNLAQPEIMILALAGLAATTACSASHEVPAVGAAGEAACVAYWLRFDYGSSVFVHRNLSDGLGDPVESPSATCRAISSSAR